MHHTFPGFQMDDWMPVLGICGYSGAGKTTLIEQLVESQVSNGRRILVIKHDAHTLNVDREGKDSYRFFSCGADVAVHNNDECFVRSHHTGANSLWWMLREASHYYDGILVEGHKDSPIRHKIWLQGSAETVPPVEGEFEHVLRQDDDRFHVANTLFEKVMQASVTARPLHGAVLIGGNSVRFGEPKHLIVSNGQTWLEKAILLMQPFVEQVVIIGKGKIPDSLKSIPRLEDVPDAAGPIAGLRAAFRWNPHVSWLFLPCDVPLNTKGALHWLLSKRKIGIDAILPRLEETAPCEPLFAWYSHRAGKLAESVSSPQQLSPFQSVASPLVPTDHRQAWTNANSPSDLPDNY